MAEIVTIGLGAVVAGATLVYVFLTRLLVAETRLMRKAETAPNIGVSLQFLKRGDGACYVVIENYGRGAAINLEFEYFHPYSKKQDKDKNLEFFKNMTGMTYFPPSQRLEAFYGMYHTLLDKHQESVVRVDLKYLDDSNRAYSSQFELDVSKFAGMTDVAIPGSDIPIEKSLSDMAVLMNRIIDFDKLRVVTKSFREQDE